MITGKKGAIVLYLMAFGLIAATVFFFVISSEKLNFQNYVGENQINILRASLRGENSLIYVDEAAKLSFDNTSYELAAKGGLIGSGCGEYAGYNIIFCNSESVLDKETAQDNFKKLFHDKLILYLLAYPDIALPVNYDYHIVEGEKTIFYGEAKNKVSVDIIKPIRKVEEIEKIEQIELGEVINLVGIECVAGINCQMKSEAALKLEEANKIAKEKYGAELVVTSAYRSPERQMGLFKNVLAKKGTVDETRELVCGPSDLDKVDDLTAYSHCPHVTGGAVDLCIKGSATCSHDAYPAGSTAVSHIDIGILQNIMYEAGFVRYSNEWWHYEFGTERYERWVAEGKPETSIV